MQSSNIVLLGPYPGNINVSINNYFNFYRMNLPDVLAPRPFTAIVPGELADLDDSTPVHHVRWRAWRDNYAYWPLQLARMRGSLYHIVDQGLAWYARFIGPGERIITVHDLFAYLSCVGKMDLAPPPRKRKLLVYECIRQIKRMRHVISVSQATADVLVREVGIPARLITVIHHHIDSSFQPPDPSERLENRARLFGKASHVVIHVGKPSVYKNRIGALRAFVTLRDRLPEARMFLVHGRPTPQESALLAEAGCEAAVTFCPPMPRDELQKFYGAADVLIFPSLYEGFGWPPLEAMACGCPVVCSNRASLKEVVGDAALVVEDPNDHRLLAEKLREVLTNDTASRELRQRGFARAAQFAPEKALRAVADVYRQVLRN